MKRSLDLGKDNLWKLTLSLALPTALAQLVNVLYSIVDRMFIGHIAIVGDLALAGAGVAAPIATFLTSFATLIGLGGAPIMAMSAGNGDKRKAETIVSTAFYLLLILSLILAPLFFIFRDNFLMWFGASDTTLEYASTYIAYYLVGTPFALISGGMNSYLINQGKTGKAMTAVLLGAVLNIILDPIFIFTLDMGIRGAAIATVISQLASSLYIIYCLRRKDMSIRLSFNLFNKSLISKIVTFGLSPFIIISTDSVLLIALNAVLQHYGGPGEGDILITAATIVQSYFTLLMNPLGGISAGCQGLISYNYGAGNVKRVKDGIICAQIVATSYTIIFTLCTIFLSPLFASLFTPDPEMIVTAAKYSQIFTLLIIPLSFQYINVDQMTALGKIKFALPLSLFRKTIFFVATLSLPYFFGAAAAFWAEPICDLLSGVLSTIIMWTQLPKILRQREQNGFMLKA